MQLNMSTHKHVCWTTEQSCVHQANGRVPSAEAQRKPSQGQLQLQQRTARAALKVWPQAGFKWTLS